MVGISDVIDFIKFPADNVRSGVPADTLLWLNAGSAYDSSDRLAPMM